MKFCTMPSNLVTTPTILTTPIMIMRQTEVRIVSKVKVFLGTTDAITATASSRLESRLAKIPGHSTLKQGYGLKFQNCPGHSRTLANYAAGFT